MRTIEIHDLGVCSIRVGCEPVKFRYRHTVHDQPYAIISSNRNEVRTAFKCLPIFEKDGESCRTHRASVSLCQTVGTTENIIKVGVLNDIAPVVVVPVRLIIEYISYPLIGTKGRRISQSFIGHHLQGVGINRSKAIGIFSAEVISSGSSKCWWIIGG